MEANWQAALYFVWRPENDGQPYHVTPGDPGGGTNMGVTEATWRDAERRGLVSGELQYAELSDLSRVLHELFWHVAGCDKLPAGVDLVVFNMAMVSGPSRAIRLLQSAVGVKQDGIWGPISQGALENTDPEEVLDYFTDDAVAFFEGLAGFERFGNGWLRRAYDATNLAHNLVVGANAE